MVFIELVTDAFSETFNQRASSGQRTRRAGVTWWWKPLLISLRRYLPDVPDRLRGRPRVQRFDRSQLLLKTYWRNAAGEQVVDRGDVPRGNGSAAGAGEGGCDAECLRLISSWVRRSGRAARSDDTWGKRGIRRDRDRERQEQVIHGSPRMAHRGPFHAVRCRFVPQRG